MSADIGTIPKHGYRVVTDPTAGGIGFGVYKQGGDCSEFTFGKNVLPPGRGLVFTNTDEWPLCDILLECDTTTWPPKGGGVDIYIFSMDIFGSQNHDEASVASDGTISGRGRLLCSTLLDSKKSRWHKHLMLNVPIPSGRFIMTIMPIACDVKAGAWLTLRRKSGVLA